MRTRSDGEQTRARILAVACEVFGELGYFKATFAEMARRGDFQPALISFHFHSKDDLYRTVWTSLNERARERWPVNGSLPPDAPAEERLRTHVRSTLNLLSDPDLAALHCIGMQERVNPTGLLEDEVRRRIQGRRDHMRGVLRDLLGEAATESDMDLCETSVTNQLFMLRHHKSTGTRHKKGKPHHGVHLPRIECSDVDGLTEHITRFSLGGVAAVREAIAQRKKSS